MPQYKASLHLHAAEDYKEGFRIKYSFFDLIDYAYKKGFKILAITFHEHFAYKSEYDVYAKEKGILLIPGIEATLYNDDNDHSNHIVILNCDKEVEKLRTFDDLRAYKQSHPDIFVMAPHPFYGGKRSIGKTKFAKHADLFDAVEHGWMYTKHWFNPNKKAADLALEYNKPLVATADLHCFKYFDHDYIVVDSSSLEIKDILNSVKQAKFTNVSHAKALLGLVHTFFITFF